jgi:hypothetical protein
MIPKDRNKKGTGFTNLGRILEASRGSRMGSAVATGARELGQNVRGQIGQAGQQFQTKAQESAAKFGEQASKERDETIGQIGAVTPSSGTGGVQQEDLAQKFQDWRDAEYKGPTGLEDYGSLAGKVTEAEQLGRMSRTSGGKQELLRRFVGGRDYSQGEQSLDTALLGLTGQRELDQARRETRGLGMELGRQAGTASEQAMQLAKQAQTFGQDTRAKLGEQKEKILSDEEYGSEGKSLKQLFQDTQTKEKGREELASKIRDFDSEFGRLVQAGSRTPDQKREAFQELLRDAQQSGYIDNSEIAQLFMTKTTGGDLSFNPEYDFITRAEELGMNPYSDLASSISEGRAAQNLNLGGFVAAQDPTRAGQLGLLERLAAVPQEASRFRGDQEKYEAGTLGLEQGTIPFRLNVLDGEISKIENETLPNVSSSTIKNLPTVMGGGIIRNLGLVQKLQSVINEGRPIVRSDYPEFWTGTGPRNSEGWRKFLEATKNYSITRDRLLKSKNYKQQLMQKQASKDNIYAKE